MSRMPSKTIIRGISLSLGIALIVGSAAPSSALGLKNVLIRKAEQLLIPRRNQTINSQTRNSERLANESRPSSPSQTESQKTPETKTDEQTTAERPRFTCEFVNGQYTVMYHPEGLENMSFPWATPTALGGGWSPEARCNEISRRLERYRPDGMIELKTAVENNHNIICVTTQAVEACRIVLTVPPGQDPVATRDRIFQNLIIADSGQQTDAVNTFMPGSQESQMIEQILGSNAASILGVRRQQPQQRIASGIDLRPFLAPSDGGTGTFLRSNRALPNSSPRLNPERFR